MADGVILYEGPSKLDGAPVVVIATGIGRSSKNAKTGGMVQTYILRADVEPTAAVRSGADASICGDCPARGLLGLGRSCYVNVGQGPLAVFRAFQRGAYPRAKFSDYPTLFPGRKVRFGTYGDPAAVPISVWMGISWFSAGWTGYTHQWRTAPLFRTLCMASVDTPEEAEEARAAGWRTFRVRLPGHAPRQSVEAVCPASAEAGKKLQCADCMACSGATGGRRGGIVIDAHGGTAVMANIRRRAG